MYTKFFCWSAVNYALGQLKQAVQHHSKEVGRGQSNKANFCASLRVLSCQTFSVALLSSLFDIVSQLSLSKSHSNMTKNIGNFLVRSAFKSHNQT